MWLKLMMHNTKTMIYQIHDPLTIQVCVRGSHVRERGYSKMVNDKDQHRLWSLTLEKISKTYSGTYFRVFDKKCFRKAKIVLLNVQFPILCTSETISKIFYYLYYMTYVTEIDTFDAQYKDNTLFYDPLAIRVCWRGYMSGGTLCMKNMIKAQN